MKKWRSRITTDGIDRAPHRAFMRAMGLDDEAIARLQQHESELKRFGVEHLQER